MTVLILCAYVSDPSQTISNALYLLFLQQGNYWGCTYASYSLIYTPGFFVHSWDLLLSDTIKPYYVRLTLPSSYFRT